VSGRPQGLGCTKTATPWGVDFKHIARLHLDLANVAQHLHAAIGAHHLIDARQATVPACHAKSRMDTTVGQDARRHRLQKAHTAHAAVTAMPAPRTA
jgi:hypothetical protein